MAQINPKLITFQHTTHYTDGSVFGADDYAGLEFAWRKVGTTEWLPTVAVPVTFDQTELDISLLDLPRNVEFELAARTVARNGLASVWTNPLGPLVFDERKPNPPVVSVS